MGLRRLASVIIIARMLLHVIAVACAVDFVFSFQRIEMRRILHNRRRIRLLFLLLLLGSVCVLWMLHQGTSSNTLTEAEAEAEEAAAKRGSVVQHHSSAASLQQVSCFQCPDNWLTGLHLTE